MFAKNRIEPFTVVAFYNGVRSQEDDYVDDGNDDEDEQDDDQVGPATLQFGGLLFFL